MITTAQFKNGLTVLLEGGIYSIVEFQHVKPGKGGAFVRTKLKNLKLGTVIERTFRAGEKIEEAFIEEKKLQYLYRSGDIFHFMDQETFEEKGIHKNQLGDVVNFLKDNMEVSASFYRGELVVVTPPIFVILRVERTEPGIRGDTAKGGSKPATLETGFTIQVPLFVNKDDLIKVDTRIGEYAGRG